MILYRPMVRGDVAAGLALSRAAGWNQTKEDWELFLKLSPTGCTVAVDDEGQVRGTVATVRYQNHLSWIGMVLVDASMQRRGIGIQLLREALHILRDEDTVKLDATPAGRHIYVQLDFVDEYPLARMEHPGPSVSGLDPITNVRAIRDDDVHRLLEFDRIVFGADRSIVLKSVRSRAPQFAYLSENADGITGYCMGRCGDRFAHIGPVVAQDMTIAKELCSAALHHASGQPVIIDSPSGNRAWTSWLHDIGFREQRPLIRMYRGTNASPGVPEKQYAILGPEFG